MNLNSILLQSHTEMKFKDLSFVEQLNEINV